ncbi:MAG TPA: RagB/SusD family nutrient uptake outer membrane protein [Puia sp.]|nr:RagB/SusD family nutrient uptake outer membrane protein [Puia sp.]
MKSKNIALFIIAIIAFPGCKKWLKEDPKSVITTNQYYQTAEDAQSAVDGIYANLYVPYTGGGRNYSYAMLELVTGQFNTVSEGNDLVNVYNLRQNSASPLLEQWFSSAYQGIEAANLVIANVPGISMDTVQRSALIGEARFLRAYFYYTLVNIFGDVPLKLTPTKSASDGLLSKTPVKDIYEQEIVPDLQAAEASGMRATPAGSGRVSTGAASALLAKVYLAMAGYPVNETANYALARNKALEVINSGNFSLFQTDANMTWFDKLNNPAFDNTQEHIWDINFSSYIVNDILPLELCPKGVTFISASAVNNDQGLLVPQTSFVASYDPADLRGQQNGFFFNNITVGGSAYNFPWSLYKFFDKGLLTNAPFSSKNFPVIRYADILLTYAEAQNAADGSPNAAAYAALNAIRTRAGLAALSGLSQSDFQNEVWKERWWELCGENQNWYDIVRTHQIFDAVHNTMVNAVGFTLPSGATFQTNNLQFPIPLAEVEINPNLK